MNQKRNIILNNTLKGIGFCVSALLLLVSCQDSTTKLAIKYDKVNQEEMELTHSGQTVSMVELDQNNTFNFVLNDLEEGYYEFNGQLLYLAPGFDLAVNIREGNPSYEGKGALENQILTKRREEETANQPVSEKMFDKAELDYADYRKFLKDLKVELDANLNKEGLSQTYISNEKKRTEKLLDALLFSYTSFHGFNLSVIDSLQNFYMANQHRANEPEVIKEMERLGKIAIKDMLPKEEIKAIEDSLINKFSYDDDVLFAMKSMGQDFLFDKKLVRDVQDSKAEREKNNSITASTHPELVKMDVIIDSVNNRSVKLGKLGNITMLTIKTMPELADAFYEKFLTANPNEGLRKPIEEAYNNIDKLKEGVVSEKFVNYLTPDDNAVSLDDLKGKYVYIDVWATWCVPCKKEIPFLKEIEEKYHDQDIEFVSISVDKERDRQKWKDMVKEMDLKGIQIMADKDFASDFVKAYNIASIPRFILLDKEGKIVSHNALRPSNPELTLLLDTLLKV